MILQVSLLHIVLGFREPSYKFPTSFTYYTVVCLELDLTFAPPSWTSILSIHGFSTFLFVVNFWFVPRMLWIQLWLDTMSFVHIFLGFSHDKAHNYSVLSKTPIGFLEHSWSIRLILVLSPLLLYDALS